MDSVIVYIYIHICMYISPCYLQSIWFQGRVASNVDYSRSIISIWRLEKCAWNIYGLLYYTQSVVLSVWYSLRVEMSLFIWGEVPFIDYTARLVGSGHTTFLVTFRWHRDQVVNNESHLKNTCVFRLFFLSVCLLWNGLSCDITK